VIRKIEKVANEDMEIMMDFIKKHFQGSIFREAFSGKHLQETEGNR
jgi:hypothetical protein